MRLPVSPARSQMAVIRASRTVCDSVVDGSGKEQEINKAGCLRADPVSKPTTTALSAKTEREVKTNAERERERENVRGMEEQQKQQKPLEE